MCTTWWPAGASALAGVGERESNRAAAAGVLKNAPAILPVLFFNPLSP